jgi:putative transposase
MMPRKIYKPQEIITKLRQVEVLTPQGKSAIDAIRSIGGTDATYYRWRQEYGGLKVDQVKRMKELEAENARLRRAVVQATASQSGANGGRTKRWSFGRAAMAARSLSSS